MSLVSCELCKNKEIQLNCDFCKIHLCKGCVGDHILDDPLNHKIVKIDEQKPSPVYLKCDLHERRVCNFRCYECNLSLCSLCVTSENHRGHTFSNLDEIFNCRKKEIQTDVQELKNVISPSYGAIICSIESQLDNLDGEYEELTTTLTKYGEEWHREIDRLVSNMKNDVQLMKTKHHEVLKEHLSKAKDLQSRVQQTLKDSLPLCNSNEVSDVIEYQSHNKELGKFPPKVEVSMPRFNSEKIESTQFKELFGLLIPISITKKEYGNIIEPSESWSLLSSSLEQVVENGSEDRLSDKSKALIDIPPPLFPDEDDDDLDWLS